MSFSILYMRTVHIYEPILYVYPHIVCTENAASNLARYKTCTLGMTSRRNVTFLSSVGVRHTQPKDV